MKHSYVVIALVASLPVFSACKKSDDDKAGSASAAASGSASARASGAASASGTAVATGSAAASGSAVASGSAAAAASAAASGTAAASGSAAAPGDLKVAVKQSGNDAGTFDGAKALYVKEGDDRNIVIPGDCALTCDDFGKDGLDYKKAQKQCPSAQWVIVQLNGINQVGEPKVGATKVQVHLGHLTGGQDMTGDWADGAKLTEVTADHVNGSVDLTNNGDEIHGAFTAKACP